MLKSFAAITLIALSGVLGLSARVAVAAGTPQPHYKGSVTAVSTSSLSIKTAKGKTHSFRLTGATTVENLGKKATLAEVTPGAPVRVEYSTGSDGSLTATVIKIGIATPNGPYFSTKETGPVITVKQDTLVINVNNSKPFGFHVAPDTRFERLGQKIPPASVKVGDMVKVDFDIASSGTLTARSVAVGVKTANGLVYTNKETGKLAALAAGSLAITTNKGEKISFGLGPKTQFKKNGRTARRGALKVGDAVEVKFEVAGDGTLVAVSVTIGTVSGGKLSFPKKTKGTVQAVSATRLTLRTDKGETVAFRLTSGTAFEKRGRAMPRGDLKVGDTVKLKYQEASDGTKAALLVRAVPNAVLRFQLDGRVVRATATALVVRVGTLSENGKAKGSFSGHALTVRMSAGASIRLDGRAAKLSALPRGSAVHIAGSLAKGTFTAAQVVGRSK
jgi:hypothetical protein